MIETIQTIDWAILRGIRSQLGCPALDFWMPKITMLGNGGILWLFSAFVLLANRKNRRWGGILLLGLALGFAVGNLWLKPMVARARPSWLDPGVMLLIPPMTDYSFPSGHTMASFMAATVLARWNRRLAVPAYLLAGLIAFSRMYLYVHFPSDVLAGAVLGVALGQLAIFWGLQFCGWRQKRTDAINPGNKSEPKR